MPLGRLRTRRDAESVSRANLLFDLDPWLDSLRRASRGQNAPAGLGRALREIDQAILEFCAHSTSSGQRPRLLQEVLIAVGRAERWLATARSLRNRPRPLSGLSPQWLQDCDDRSPEFRLAAALASIQGDRDRRVGSIRTNLEPVKWERGRWDWDNDNPSVVWHGGDPLSALAAVLERRCLEARMKSLEHLPLRGLVEAPLADVHAFLKGEVDYQRIADLLLPLTAINWWEVSHEFTHLPAPPTLSRAYAVLKLLFLPWDFRRYQEAEPVHVRPEPALLPWLRAGRPIEDTLRLATNRLWASGAGRALSRESDFPRDEVPRLTAALLFPVRQWDVRSSISNQSRQTLSRMVFGPVRPEENL